MSAGNLVLLLLRLLPQRAEPLVDEGRARKVVGSGEVDLPVAVQYVVVGGVSEGVNWSVLSFSFTAI